MQQLTSSEIVKTPSLLKEAVESGEEVRIVWKEPKPGGKVVLSAVIKKEKD